MRLVRLALLFIDKASSELKIPHFLSGEIDMRVMSYEKIAGINTLVIAAEKTLKNRPKISAQNLVVVPRKEREILEECIEHYANIISVLKRKGRKILSPANPIGFIPESQHDVHYLQNARGILRLNKGQSIFWFNPAIDILGSFEDLNDRLDGIALMAEVHSQSHATGRFVECIRLFERAFSLSGRRLIDPLFTYLPDQMNYSKCEISNWSNMRDGAIHADKRKKILFESDVVWILPRIQQACYDVLFNKETWRAPDTARASRWRPRTMTTTPGGAVTTVVGERAHLRVEPFDQFGRFPLALGWVRKLPQGWWDGPSFTSSEEPPDADAHVV